MNIYDVISFITLELIIVILINIVTEEERSEFQSKLGYMSTLSKLTTITELHFRAFIFVF